MKSSINVWWREEDPSNSEHGPMEDSREHSSMKGRHLLTTVVGRIIGLLSRTHWVKPRFCPLPHPAPTITWAGGRVQLKHDGTRWRKVGEVREELANGVGSHYLSHYLGTYMICVSEHGVSNITTVDAHTSAVSSRLNWRRHRLKWTRLFRRKTKSGLCACAITFQTQSTKTPIL
jgi:hypothetical protein